MEGKEISKREKKKEEKRNKMLEIAMEEFASKAYSDVSTDVITARCGISKGLLFHYFTSKKNLYLICLETALKQTTYAPVKAHSALSGTGREVFYELLWAQLEARLELDSSFPLEKSLIEMASREEAEEVRKEKKELLDKFLHLKEILAARGISEAMDCLPIKDGNPHLRQGVNLYINAVWADLMKDQEKDSIQDLKEEFISYIDIMLDGIL